MRGGAAFFRGSSGAAARAYLAADRTATADDYYLEHGELTARRFVFEGDGQLTDMTEFGAEQYQAWVEWVNPITGEMRGRRRENSVLFLDKAINVDKTLSVAAVLDPEVARQLDAAMSEMAHELMTYTATQMHTRVGPMGGQVWKPIEKLEAVTVAHRTSREGDPHRHLHLQILNRVWADGKWRALDTREFTGHNEAMNRLAEAMLNSHEGLQNALAQAGLTFDRQTGAVVELAEAAEALSKRAGQISQRRAELVTRWEAEHPGQSPGQEILKSLDHLAWAQTRREKVPGELPDENSWRAEIAATGFLMPTGPRERVTVDWAEVDKPALIQRVMDRLETSRSAWSVAQVSAAVSAEIGKTGITERPEYVRYLVQTATEFIVDKRCKSIDPDVDPLNAPHHLKLLTTEQIIEQERDLQALMLTKALEPVTDKVSLYGEQHTLGEYQDMDQGLLEAVFAASASKDPDGNPVRIPEGEGHRAALTAISGSHQLVVVTGAAGSGKTTLLKAAKHVAAAKGLRQVIVTPTAKAAEVAAAETGSASSTVHSLLRAYGYRWQSDPDTGKTVWERLSVGQSGYQGVPEAHRLDPGVQLVVDEAGMLSQDLAQRLFTILHESGARAVITGDYRQLGAVGRGGVLQMAEHATSATVDLDRIHRFRDAEYAELTRAMRQRTDPGSQFDQLVQMGLVRLHESQERASAALAGEWAKDTYEGYKSLISAATNENAQQINASIDHIRPSASTASLVGMDGLTMSEGALIMTRRNDAQIGVLNRQTWIIRQIGQTHTKIQDPEGGHKSLYVPNEYLTEHAHLGYAVTAHGAQGMTVDRAHTLIDDHTDAAALYVGMSRGRGENIAHFIADDLAQAREQYIAAMSCDRADHGLHAARQLLAAQMKGISLTEGQQPPKPVRKPVSELRLGDQIKTGGELCTVVASTPGQGGQIVTIRPSENPERGSKTRTLDAQRTLEVFPPSPDFPAPEAERARFLAHLAAQQERAEKTARALTSWAEHRESAQHWLSAHPEAAELAEVLDTVGAQLARIRTQSERELQAQNAAHQARTAALRAHMQQKQAEAEHAGLFRRRSARAQADQARDLLAAHEAAKPPMIPQQTLEKIQQLTAQKTEVFQRYEALAREFSQEVPTPGESPLSPLHAESIQEWRHLLIPVKTATSETTAQAQQVREQVKLTQKKREYFAQDAPRANAALWARLDSPGKPAPVRGVRPPEALHRPSERDIDRGLGL